MMVAVGLAPVTGQPLPLVSRGGTSTIINCVYIGMMLSVSRYADQVERTRQHDARIPLLLATTATEPPAPTADTGGAEIPPAAEPTSAALNNDEKFE